MFINWLYNVHVEILVHTNDCWYEYTVKSAGKKDGIGEASFLFASVLEREYQGAHTSAILRSYYCTKKSLDVAVFAGLYLMTKYMFYVDAKFLYVGSSR